MGVFLSCSNDINPHTREGCDYVNKDATGAGNGFQSTHS